MKITSEQFYEFQRGVRASESKTGITEKQFKYIAENYEHLKDVFGGEEMSKAVRRDTPIEVLYKSIKSVFTLPISDEEKGNEVRKFVDKSLVYEQEYYNTEYSSLHEEFEKLKTENEVLKTQNRVLAMYINAKDI